MLSARGFLRNNGLSHIVFALFLVFLLAQALTGARQYNEVRREHGETPVGMADYLSSGHFIEATTENWESEFLSVVGMIVLSIRPRQCGSPESKPVHALHDNTGNH